MPHGFAHKGRICGLFAVLAVVAPGACASGCSAPVPSLQLQSLHSRWQEFDAQGHRIVRESGNLHAVGLQLDGQCAGLDWSVQLQQASGTRGYDGTSSTGQAIQTHSDLRQTRLQAQLWYPLGNSFAVGGRGDWTQIQRDLADTGPVRGYPERYRYLQLAAGVRYQVAEWSGLRLGADAWLGGGPSGQLHLQLPNADATNLDLGSSRLAELGLQLAPAQPADALGWSWQLRLHYRQEQMRAGPAQAITRNGVLVGAANQPKTRQSAAGLQAGLRYNF